MSNVNDARRDLHGFLSDMTALRPYVDASTPEGKAFQAALLAAKEKAIQAAEAYVNALKA